MPALLSHYRPDHQIFTFTENRAVQRRLALYHGVTAIHMRFGETADETFDRCLPAFYCSTPRVCLHSGPSALGGHQFSCYGLSEQAWHLACISPGLGRALLRALAVGC
jgi:hypothetical protein